MVNSTKKPTFALAAVVVVLVVVFAISLQQGWLQLPTIPKEPVSGGYKEVTEPGFEDTPFIENPEGERIVPDDYVPIVEFYNQTAHPDNVSIPLHYRMKFLNLEDQAYTLLIPEIGIEEQLPPGEIFEASFYKNCDCLFWLDELGINQTNGTVHVG